MKYRARPFLLPFLESKHGKAQYSTLPFSSRFLVFDFIPKPENKKENAMNTTDQEALDYFYEELDSYYDEDEQGEIFDGLDD